MDGTHLTGKRAAKTKVATDGNGSRGEDDEQMSEQSVESNADDDDNGDDNGDDVTNSDADADEDEVEAIVADKIDNGQTLYRLRFKNCSPSKDEWHNESAIE